jgi:hypothetical protein
METTTIHLNTEDKQHCDNLFYIYSSHISHVSGLLQVIVKNNQSYQARNIDEQEIFSISEIEKATEALIDLLENLTQSLILKLEKYFKEKYCLVFNSLIPDRGSVNLDPVPSYNFIVENITKQVGENLQQSGKQQIINRFLKCFYSNSLPTLKGNKITILHFVSIDAHHGEKTSLNYDYNLRIEHLLNALNLFLNNSTELPQDIQSKLVDWKRSLNLADHYTVFPEVSFKFYKNRRIDMLFANAITAIKFWNYYRLENIEKVINEND